MKKREVLCKGCGEKRSIAAQQNTAGGYLCPQMHSKTAAGEESEGGKGMNTENKKGFEHIEDCIPLLLSGDPEKRLIGEYWETKIRCAALKEELERRTEEEHKWNESAEYHMMSRQLSDMLGYLSCLGLRAVEKDIDLMDTEIPDDEYFIRINGNKGIRRVQIDGFSVVCIGALLNATAETAISAKKEEMSMEEFIEKATADFTRRLCEAAQGQAGK